MKPNAQSLGKYKVILLCYTILLKLSHFPDTVLAASRLDPAARKVKKKASKVRASFVTEIDSRISSRRDIKLLQSPCEVAG